MANVATIPAEGQDDLWAIVRKLLNGETLDPKHRVHQLHNDRKGQWECHIQPDWLLIWE